jgi:hypothetical protein
VKNGPKCSPTHFWSNLMHNLCGGIALKCKLLLCSFKKTVQSKLLPDGGKFAQSGHPEDKWNNSEECPGGVEQWTSHPPTEQKIPGSNPARV